MSMVCAGAPPPPAVVPPLEESEFPSPKVLVSLWIFTSKFGWPAGALFTVNLNTALVIVASLGMFAEMLKT